ncbi:hypothetical protein EDD11_004440 [Mortierella claussenii]|nr:hypothetical protein EDD11_004440 [Mortierella claussenii]
MFHIASPPLTPSGVMPRQPSAYSSFTMNNNIKRPPLWPMDARAPIMPFPRQIPTSSQSSKAPDRKSSALLSGGNSGGNANTLGKSRLERRASSGAILNNNLWPLPSEPLSPSYGSSLPQQQQLQLLQHQRQHQQQQQQQHSYHQHTLQLNGSNVEFTMGRLSGQQGGGGALKPTLNRSVTDSQRDTLYMNTSQDMLSIGQSPFSEDDISVSGQDFSNDRSSSIHPLGFLESKVRQHLAAPLPIRQRSLPDIFRLTPLSHDPSIGTATAAAGMALPTSPFYQPGNKGLFLSVSCEGGEGVSPTSTSSPLRLHSIPELQDLYTSSQGLGVGAAGGEAVRRRSSFAGQASDMLQPPQGEVDFSDSDDSSSLDQGFLPSSLNDLLTTHERQRRQSRQEDSFLEAFRSTSMLPSPASGSLRGERDEDEVQYSSSASGSAGIKQRVFGEFDRRLDVPISPLTMISPGGQMSSSYSSVQDRVSLFEEDEQQRSHYKECSGTPDPFCPFPNDADDQVQFAMDDDIVATGDIRMTAGASRLDRAVGSNSNLHRTRLQHEQKFGILTPQSLVMQGDGSDDDSLGAAKVDFASLSISDAIVGSKEDGLLSYAGIIKFA